MATAKEALQALTAAEIEQSRAKFPSMPEEERTQIYKNKVRKLNTSNGLTQAVIGFISCKGGIAIRVSSAGRKIKGKGGKEIFIKSTTRRGAADIMATYAGLSLSIEVKCLATGDAKRGLSEKQQELKADTEAAGGIYYVAETWEGFYNWFIQLETQKRA